MRSRFARSASSMCPGRQFSFSSKKLVVTGFFESVCRVSGVMNSVASLRHHDEDIVALLDEQTGELGGFVGGDRTGDPEDDAFRFGADSGVFGSVMKWINSERASAQITFRAHDVAKFLQILFHRFADDRVAIVAPKFHFARGCRNAQLDLLLRFRFRASSGGGATLPDRAA